jgi:hypothetical protein
MVASPALAAARVPPAARRRGRGTTWSLPRREAGETSQSARRRPYGAGECESSTDDLSATHGPRAASRSIGPALRAVVDPQSTRRPACRITRGGGEHKDHHQRRYFHVGIGRGRPSGGGRSRCVTYSPRHARCHFLTPIDSRDHEREGSRRVRTMCSPKANAVALVSAPFLPEPGSRARVVDGGQVLHVSRLLIVRRTPLLPLALQTAHVHLQEARQYLSWLADASTDTDPLDSAVGRDLAVRDYHTYPQAALKRKPATINNALPAVDDLYTRRGLGPSRAARVEVPATASRALGERVHTCEQSRLGPRPATRRSRWSRSTPALGSTRPSRSTSATCACANRARQPAAARRATPATTRSASTRRGSVRGQRRSRSRGARSSSSP